MNKGLKTYGKPKVINGVEYVRIYPLWKIPFVRISNKLQYLLWRCGIHIHNPITNECTPDFGCCAHIWKGFQKEMKEKGIKIYLAGDFKEESRDG